MLLVLHKFGHFCLLFKNFSFAFLFGYKQMIKIMSTLRQPFWCWKWFWWKILWYLWTLFINTLQWKYWILGLMSWHHLFVSTIFFKSFYMLPRLLSWLRLPFFVNKWCNAQVSTVLLNFWAAVINTWWWNAFWWIKCA